MRPFTNFTFQDLPPPYSENPPMNPFYSERHDISGLSDLDHSGLDDSRPLVVSPPSQPATTHDPLYQHQQVQMECHISNHLINLSTSTSTPSCIRSRRRTRRQTPLRPSLSFHSSTNNLTLTPSLAAGRSLAAIQAQGSSSGEKTATCLTGRPARRWRALPTFIFGLNRTSCPGYLPTKARLQFVVSC